MVRHNIIISHAEKIMFPKSGITKGNLIDYYDGIADRMLPYLKDRPLTLHRFPEGLRVKGFFQKNASGYFPDWIRTARVKKKEGWVDHVVCDNKDTLVYLANQGTITFHVALSKLNKLDYPDRLIFDLDPPSADFRPVVEGAKILREFLEADLGLRTYLMITGSKGLHITVPLVQTENFDIVHDFAKNVAEHMVKAHPDKFTTAMRKDQREGKLFLDYLRNSYGQTGVCPFSVRAIEGAPVATPLYWDELEDNALNARTYTIKNIFIRLKKKDDPWENMESHTISISRPKAQLMEMMQLKTRSNHK